MEGDSITSLKLLNRSYSNKKLLITLLISGIFLCPLSFIHKNILYPTAHAHTDAYDISQYQGYITNHQAKKLKHEVSFVILRAQAYGADSKIKHNIHVMNKNHIPYGVYSYSYYNSPRSAKREAKSLYHLAPHAKFYVNDCEENDVGRRLNQATQSWSKQLHKLTNRPVVLYSGLWFLETHFTHKTLKLYNTVWLATYSSIRPRTKFHYDLWQFTDNHYSRALRERLDADKRPKHSEPLSFWIGNNYTHRPIQHSSRSTSIRPIKKVSMHHIQHMKKLLSNKHIYHHTNKKYYYHGHHFIVTKPHGIKLYMIQTARHIKLTKGTKLIVRHFIHTQHGSYAVGFYNGYLATFSGNKENIRHV